MRIALHADGEVGRRTGRILLAERDLTALGIYGSEGGTEDRKMTRIADLTGSDALVTDAPDSRSFALVAAEEGVSCVVGADLRVDRRLARRFLDAGLTLLIASGLGGGIAETLASHEQARTERNTSITIAWTTSGRPLRRGRGIPFPDPVGPRWASRVGRRIRRRDRAEVPIARFVAPVPPPWAGALVRVAGLHDEHPVDQVVGVADQGPHLEAIALAAGAVSVARGSYPPGVHRPSVAAEAYLQTALDMGLGVASYTLR